VLRICSITWCLATGTTSPYKTASRAQSERNWKEIIVSLGLSPWSSKPPKIHWRHTVQEISLQRLFKVKNRGKVIRCISDQWPGKTFLCRDIFNYSLVGCPEKIIHSRYTLYFRGEKASSFKIVRSSGFRQGPRDFYFLVMNFIPLKWNLVTSTATNSVWIN
jgi:hypothetical protein